MAATTGARWVPMLVGGRWETGETDQYAEVHNPSTGCVIAQVPLGTAQDVDRAVRAAAAAAPAWAATPAVERARVLFRFRDRLVAESDELALMVTREHGKTLVESRASVQRGIEMVEFACGIPSLLMGQSLPNIAPGVDCETARHPLGVCAGITPSNFPVMVPLWMAPVALACGNTFVLKPSEKVPLCSVRLGELLLQSGLPEGVFNIVHGDKQCVDALLAHPLVRGISFVGSTPVARYVYETAARNGKRAQAAGGAKNHLVIMPDADLDQAVAAVQASAFGCAGQRCMAGSLALAVADVADGFVDRLCASAARMRVGPTDGGDSVDMGPVISRQHLERVSGYLDIGRAEGAEITLDGRAAARSEGFLIGPSVLDRVEPGMRVAREEIFGPVLSVVRVHDLEEALAVGRACLHGNGASIFTRSGRAAREFSRRFNAGMIGINVGVPAPMAWFPFTGWNQSFFGDLHIQGIEGVHFYTQQKMTMSRWPETAADSRFDPVWSAGGRRV
jgi:malonate-semialdehyde dehydrogenase (acetylating) / methylmalonate-semialdehyde dehydrogenase